MRFSGRVVGLEVGSYGTTCLVTMETDDVDRREITFSVPIGQAPQLGQRVDLDVSISTPGDP